MQDVSFAFFLGIGKYCFGVERCKDVLGNLSICFGLHMALLLTR